MGKLKDRLNNIANSPIDQDQVQESFESTRLSNLYNTTNGSGWELVAFLNDRYYKKFAENETSYSDSWDWRDYFVNRIVQIQIDNSVNTEYGKPILDLLEKSPIPNYICFDRTILYPESYGFPIVFCTLISASEYEIDECSAGLFLGFNEVADYTSGELITNPDDLDRAIAELVEKEIKTLDALGQTKKHRKKAT